MAKSTRSKRSQIKSTPPVKTGKKNYKNVLYDGTGSAAVRMELHEQPAVAVPVTVENNFLQWMTDLHVSKRPKSDFDILTISKEGISKLSFDRLANFLGVSRKSMAEDIFDISVKTFERKDPKEKLDKKTSSHAVEIARVLQHASEVFEDDNKVRNWIHKENRALNNMKPIDLFDTLTGLNLVNDILGRIEEGVYS